ncbi:hypothetical protein LCGC14_0303140 [marine sediment metagenome]|uniref:Uncharacterized protein n=1 Tax=marine sediment metagenome TaxID=412755 RepID=A0A0F9WVS6_9ZZZZ
MTHSVESLNDHDIFMFNRLEDIKDRKALVNIIRGGAAYTGYIVGVYILDTIANEFTEYDGEKSKETYKIIAIDLDRVSDYDRNFPFHIVLPYATFTGLLERLYEMRIEAWTELDSPKKLKKMLKKMKEKDLTNFLYFLEQAKTTRNFFASTMLAVRAKRLASPAIVTLSVHLRNTIIEEIPMSRFPEETKDE